VVLAGCQTGQFHEPPLAEREAIFRNLWALYGECRTLTEPATARLAALRVAQAAPSALPRREAPPAFLPNALTRYIENPPLRMSVDPWALAADCAVHAGTVALEADRLDLARELFRLVILNHSHADYAYYVAQAQQGLIRMNRLLADTPQIRLVAWP
jgi:hypothetical protein